MSPSIHSLQTLNVPLFSVEKSPALLAFLQIYRGDFEDERDVRLQVLQAQLYTISQRDQECHRDQNATHAEEPAHKYLKYVALPPLQNSPNSYE